MYDITLTVGGLSTVAKNKSLADVHRFVTGVTGIPKSQQDIVGHKYTNFTKGNTKISIKRK